MVSSFCIKKIFFRNYEKKLSINKRKEKYQTLEIKVTIKQEIKVKTLVEIKVEILIEIRVLI